MEPRVRRFGPGGDSETDKRLGRIEERLEKLEKNIDRLIEALERRRDR